MASLLKINSVIVTAQLVTSAAVTGLRRSVLFVDEYAEQLRSRQKNASQLRDASHPDAFAALVSIDVDAFKINCFRSIRHNIGLEDQPFLVQPYPHPSLLNPPRGSLAKANRVSFHWVRQEQNMLDVIEGGQT